MQLDDALDILGTSMAPTIEEALHDETQDRLFVLVDQVNTSKQLASTIMQVAEIKPAFCLAIAVARKELTAIFALLIEAGRLMGRQEVMDEFLPKE